MPFLFLFLDGVGLGSDDATVNPFAAAETLFLEKLLGGKFTASLAERSRPNFIFKPIDATLDFDGLPQSATGQTALLTGRNGATIMEGHYGPYPGPTLKKVLDEGTLFSEVLAEGRQAQLANVYPPGFFEALKGRKRRVNVPVYAAQVAGLELLELADYREGRGVSVDLTGEYLKRLDADLPALTPKASGKRLAREAAQVDFTFFDFWLTDASGHRGSFEEAVSLVEKLDSLLAGVVASLGETTLLLTSDHGNLEDKTTRSHTTAPVPLLAIGAQAEHFAEVSSLLGVAPAIRAALNLKASPPAVAAG